MSDTVSDYLVKRLREWGVTRVFGYPGDGINGVFGALDRMSDEITFVPSRHEELAAFMACAHAKFTGETAVCVATSGPGAVHLLNGLYDAKKDNMPVVAIVGQQARMSLGSEYLQEVDLVSLFKDVAGDYVTMVTTAEAMRTAIDQAMRIAKAERTVTAIIVPNDLQIEAAAPIPPRVHGSVRSGVGYSRPDIVPTQHDLRRAADVLNAGRRVAMLVGAGALDATDEVIETAERLGAGIAKALLGKAAVPDDVPYCTGSIGLLGTEATDKMMREADTLLMVGSNFPYSEWLPTDDQARGVQIDIKPRHLNLRFPMEVPLHGDAKQTLAALLPMLEQRDNDDWQQKIRKWVTQWWDEAEERSKTEADPINPQRVFWELSAKLPDRCIVTCDSGSAANWFARELKLRRGMMASLSGGLATMCPGVPYALAAKLAHPDRPVVACVGDGAMQMLGNNALVDIAQASRTGDNWADPRLIVLVLNNGDLNQVTWEQRVMVGDPRYDASQTVPAFSYANYAQQLGLRGIEVRQAEQVVSAIDQAMGADRPVVLDMHTDPDVPPLPPHISLEQARHFMFAMAGGDSHRGGVIRQAVEQVAAAWLPGHGD